MVVRTGVGALRILMKRHVPCSATSKRTYLRAIVIDPSANRMSDSGPNLLRVERSMNRYNALTEGPWTTTSQSHY